MRDLHPARWAITGMGTPQDGVTRSPHCSRRWGGAACILSVVLQAGCRRHRSTSISPSAMFLILRLPFVAVLTGRATPAKAPGSRVERWSEFGCGVAARYRASRKPSGSRLGSFWIRPEWSTKSPRNDRWLWTRWAYGGAGWTLGTSRRIPPSPGLEFMAGFSGPVELYRLLALTPNSKNHTGKNASMLDRPDHWRWASTYPDRRLLHHASDGNVGWVHIQQRRDPVSG